MSIYKDYLKFIEDSRVLEEGSFEDKIERLLSLSNEVGELQGLYKKEIRDKKQIDKYELISELGDVLYSICAIISLEKLTVDEVICFNIDKLTKRYNK